MSPFPLVSHQASYPSIIPFIILYVSDFDFLTDMALEGNHEKMALLGDVLFPGDATSQWSDDTTVIPDSSELEWFNIDAYYGECEHASQRSDVEPAPRVAQEVCEPSSIASITATVTTATKRASKSSAQRPNTCSYASTPPSPSPTINAMPPMSANQFSNRPDDNARPQTDNVAAITSNRVSRPKYRPRNPYTVDEIYPFMWSNISQAPYRASQNGPGKHGVKISTYFGALDSAKAHLAKSYQDRKSVVHCGLSASDARRHRDRRRDFFCFMSGCGLCFERGDKLERHLIGTNVHGTTKPWICPHHTCEKAFELADSLKAHMIKHAEAGHAALPFPYPWNCPYPAVVKGLQRSYLQRDITAEDISIAGVASSSQTPHHIQTDEDVKYP
ncbi:MAG TPA: hypothetical protein VGO47_09275, partial [Chlamydiales bacterium]|nr:hypothetical protein [Chlamydiales bacterium]